MPAVSEAQRRYLYARFGKQWAAKHHFNNAGTLPAHVRKRKRRHPLTGLSPR